jgi:raffinose/stachyose/melibiose transport system permease protein
MLVYPIAETLIKSFYDWDGISDPVFSGIDNYKNLVQDADFWISVKNGLIFSAVIFVYQQGMATILALLFTTKGFRVRGSRFFRTSYFVPVILSSTVVGQLWLQIFKYDHGLLNSIIENFSDKIPFLADPKIAIYAVSFTNGWQFMGITFVFLYTAIKSIPEQYYDAALIDGASSIQAHRNITLPLLVETYKVTFVMSLTGGLKAFDSMYIMTGGGPGNSTMTLTYLMYKSAFFEGEFGYGCASAMALVIECILVLVLINKLMGRERIMY